MKAIALTGIRKMELIDLPLPHIKNPSDVLLKVNVVGVCGSDVHYYVSGKIGSQVVKYPYLVGHEFAGTVIKKGRAAKHIHVGSRVAVEPAMSCGKCDQCRSGRRHTCRKLRFLGCPGQADGCLCEYIVMPAECCYPLKKRSSLEQGALAEPLSIGLYAVQLAKLKKNASIAVLGAGPIGLSVLLSARAHGIKKIYVTDKIEPRLSAAKKAGAVWAGDPDKGDVVKGILNSEPLQLDAVFECCGQQSALDQAVKLLKPGGKLMLVGIPTVDRISFPIDDLRRREICIQNVRRQNECMQPALDLIESGKIDTDFMITHRYRLEESKKAFDLVAGYRDGVIKALITM